MKKLTIQRKTFLIYLLAFTLIWSCSKTDKTNKDSQGITRQDTFSFSDAAMTIPSPASVHLGSEGRLGKRFQGNIKYVRFQYDHYGDFMLDAFASRHYSPGKLLERVWDGEYAGKWLDAATRIAVNTGDSAQLAMVDSFAKSLRRYQQPDGYMGIPLPRDRELNDWEQGWDVWNQWYALTGFLTHHEFRGQQASLEAASGVGKWIVKTFSPIKDKNASFFEGMVDGFTNVSVIKQLVRLYRYTGNEDLLNFVGQVIRHYPPIQQMLSTGKPYLVHPYPLSAVLGGVAEYAKEKRDYEMLTKVEQVWDGLVSNHMFPTGSLGDREDLSDKLLKDTPNGQLQETCATVYWIFFTQDLYEITGRVKYVEALENTCYNALLAAQSTDCMKWCYWTPLRYNKNFLYGPTRCCFWNGPRGIARLPQLIYATKGNGVYINFFETSNATLNTDSGKVHITQDTEFPETGKSSISLKTPSDWRGTLNIRIPGWARNFQASLNGHPIQNISDQEGYFSINLKNSREYNIDIQFEIPLMLEKFKGDNYVMRRGPEVLSIDARDNIDTWLGAKDNLITIPKHVKFEPIKSYQKHQWAGPIYNKQRRKYKVKVYDARTDELRGVLLTPYADAGNEGAAFRTVFPKEK